MHLLSLGSYRQLTLTVLTSLRNSSFFHHQPSMAYNSPMRKVHFFRIRPKVHFFIVRLSRCTSWFVPRCTSSWVVSQSALLHGSSQGALLHSSSQGALLHGSSQGALLQGSPQSTLLQGSHFFKVRPKIHPFSIRAHGCTSSEFMQMRYTSSALVPTGALQHSCRN